MLDGIPQCEVVIASAVALDPPDRRALPRSGRNLRFYQTHRLGAYAARRVAA